VQFAEKANFRARARKSEIPKTASLPSHEHEQRSLAPRYARFLALQTETIVLYGSGKKLLVALKAGGKGE